MISIIQFTILSYCVCTDHHQLLHSTVSPVAVVVFQVAGHLIRFLVIKRASYQRERYGLSIYHVLIIIVVILKKSMKHYKVLAQCNNDGFYYPGKLVN